MFDRGDASPTQVRFTVLDFLKGRVSTKTIEFNGELTQRDDRNDHVAPYKFVRPGGRRGNYFGMAYREWSEYLLMLRRQDPPSATQPGVLTPCWSPLSPTNEQLFDGVDDSWFIWVRQQLLKR